MWVDYSALVRFGVGVGVKGVVSVRVITTFLFFLFACFVF